MQPRNRPLHAAGVESHDDGRMCALTVQRQGRKRGAGMVRYFLSPLLYLSFSLLSFSLISLFITAFSVCKLLTTATITISSSSSSSLAHPSSPRFVVCEYHPHGNVIGNFTSNVQAQLPPDEQPPPPTGTPNDPQGPSPPPQQEPGGRPCPQGGDCSAAVRRWGSTATLPWIAVGVWCLVGVL